MHETQRTRDRRVARPYTSAERDRRRAAVEAWVAKHGWLCPGWRRDPHPVTPGNLTADHPIAVATGGDEAQEHDVLCRECNSSKGTR